MTQTYRSDTKSRLGILLKGSISAALIAWLISQVDLATFSARLTTAHQDWVGAAAALLLLQVVIAAQRWQWVLRALRISLGLREALRIVFVGLFFNQTLPTTVGGDIVRVLELRRANITIGRATTSVVLDRLSALLAVLLIVALSLPLLLALINETAPKISLLVASLGGLLGLVGLAHLDLLVAVLPRWKLPTHVQLLLRNGRRVLFGAHYSAHILGSSLLVTIISGISVGLIARSLDIEVDILTCVVLVPPVLLISTLPVSLAGWGVREAAMVVAMSYAHVGTADALLLSIAFGCIVMAMGLPGGILWLLRSYNATRPPIAPAKAH